MIPVLIIGSPLGGLEGLFLLKPYMTFDPYLCVEQRQVSILLCLECSRIGRHGCQVLRLAAGGIGHKHRHLLHAGLHIRLQPVEHGPAAMVNIELESVVTGIPRAKGGAR